MSEVCTRWDKRVDMGEVAGDPGVLIWNAGFVLTAPGWDCVSPPCLVSHSAGVVVEAPGCVLGSPQAAQRA